MHNVEKICCMNTLSFSSVIRATIKKTAKKKKETRIPLILGLLILMTNQIYFLLTLMKTGFV